MNTLTNPSPASAVPTGESPYRRATPTLLEHIGRSIWRALEAFGHRRAARELNQLADRWESHDPELARALRAASQVNPTR